MENSNKSRFSFFDDTTDKGSIVSVNKGAQKIQTNDNINSVFDPGFVKAARYRCTQINVTQVQNEVTFSSDIKTQYLLSKSVDNPNHFHVQLEDYIYNVDPKPMEAAFQIVVPVEFIRNNIKFIQNSNAEITDITNLKEIYADWEKFSTNDLPEIDFFKLLKDQNPKTTDDIINTGNRELSSVEGLRTLIEKNLFYHVLLNANLGENISDKVMTQLSQLFPDLHLNINVFQTKIKEEGPLKTFLLTGVLQRDNLSDDMLRQQYDELYKPLIKFSYTEFDYLYTVNYTVDVSSKILISATANIREKIKNNYESITEFNVRRVEL